ncbi:membrane protein [Xanthomonas phaseoli pv. phaseoli]|uniref:Transmembrane protein n=5 Tax=Xanthomonas TaxID=338 RepID=A0AAI7ZGX9_XANAC|nr:MULTISPECIES: hypothetical protein [Xanthomonas]OOW59010.1 hypothetical protein Xths_04745 [Xanthomonas campestris pv. thespesiae]OOW80173.1 hypothetical protein Xlen_01305 [Xanthomonas campestris pv. leeana]OOW97491.1 hypothetical protein Xvtr_04775 [Xanthomonas campestris pv. vitiscarnosae]AAM37805.1 conserved hypothetical protein [Xanthomonas citri pv. citri str. 306]AGH78437.1 hypothetical protein XAC29_15050 [Xanthomonas axonopodis Xac29-1]
MDAFPVATTASASTDDLQHLKLLSIFHYVLAGLTGLFSLIPLIHLFMGLAIVTGRLPMKDSTGQTAPQEIQLFGWVFVIIAAMLILGGLTMAGFMAYAGRCIAQRRRHLLCLIVAGISCSFMPFGTVLGVFTLVTLLRPQVKALFGVGNAAA